MPSLKLVPYFLNHEIALNLLGASVVESRAYLPSEADNNLERQSKHHAVCRALAEHLDAIGMTDLEKAVLRKTIRVGDIVGIEQAFYFRRVPGPGGKPRIFMHGKLHTDATVQLEASVDFARMTSDTGGYVLSGRSAAYVLAVVADIEDTKITLRPFFIGTLGIGGSETIFGPQPINGRRIYPSKIDQFSKADFTRKASAKHLRLVADMAESDVKTHLAEIIGEAFVPQDWGGEKSDLYTSTLSINGQQVSAAFLLKGKSVKRPMQIGDLGKNGDQLDRLSSEPVELLVVQSNQSITSFVVNMAEVYAHDIRNLRRYMILDGADSARILSAYGYI